MWLGWGLAGAGNGWSAVQSGLELQQHQTLQTTSLTMSYIGHRKYSRLTQKVGIVVDWTRSYWRYPEQFNVLKSEYSSLLFLLESLFSFLSYLNVVDGNQQGLYTVVTRLVAVVLQSTFDRQTARQRDSQLERIRPAGRGRPGGGWTGDWTSGPESPVEERTCRSWTGGRTEAPVTHPASAGPQTGTMQQRWSQHCLFWWFLR